MQGMVHRSRKDRAHPEMSIPPEAASISLGMSASPAATSTHPTTLTQFSQLPYSSPVPISTPLLHHLLRGRHRGLSLHQPLAQGDNDSCILILPIADRYMS
ncbi:hypothetical protein M9H77_02681 [Catharanthus roseus]|uniref:Uncharacterized protein n=1 Tax=Catharanthus roseus TaxID=4058 RepID=A0ACC0C9H8_CATRO|nr:hypothetical protein M9H77_02681 [Catharanthus roseus]